MKCHTSKCTVTNKPYPPGMHTKNRYRSSEYLTQKREKQKCARVYSVFEKQFRAYYKKAANKAGKTGDNLLRMLESRFDNVIFRSSFAQSRKLARQLITHNHFLVNNKKMNIPSYQVKEGDVITVREESIKLAPFLIAQNASAEAKPISWLDINVDKMQIVIRSLNAVNVKDIMDVDINEQLIVELYSK